MNVAHQASSALFLLAIAATAVRQVFWQCRDQILIAKCTEENIHEAHSKLVNGTRTRTRYEEVLQIMMAAGDCPRSISLNLFVDAHWKQQ
jgi:hypothetical protein